MSAPTPGQIAAARFARPCIDVDADACLGEAREATARQIAAALPVDALSTRAVLQDIDTPREILFVRPDRDRPWDILIGRADRQRINPVFLAMLAQAVRRRPSLPEGIGDDQGWP